MSTYLHASDVAAHTAARNALNTASIALRDELVTLLTPYLGAKIRKVSGYGGWVAKLAPQIEAMRERHSSADPRLTFHFEFSVRSFWIETKSFYYPGAGGSGVHYVRQTLSLGGWDQTTGELVSLVSADDRGASNPKTDWQAAEIVALQARISSLKAELSDAESILRLFV
jgi:hypothetical protein